MARFVELCVFLCTLSLVFGERINFSGIGEAILCRSYSSAKNEGILDICKNLWKHATVFPANTKSIDCSTCNYHLQNRNYYRLSSLLKRQQNLTVFADEIRNLHSELDYAPLLCALLDRCDHKSFVLPSLKFRLNTTCDDCKKIIDDVRNLIQDNDTKNAVSGYLKKAVCFELPLQVVDICKRTIDSYIGILMDLAASEIDSGPVCALFGLCSSIKVPMTLQTKPQAGSYSWIKRPAPVGFEFFHSRLGLPKRSEDSAACTECINVFSRIRDETTNPDFDRILKNAVKDKLCESFGYFKSMCEAAVSSEVDSMIDNASNMNITDLCFFFNQCSQNVSSRARALKMELFSRFALRPQQDARTEFVCSFCEMIFEKVFDLILNNKSEAVIIWALDEVCHLLPEKSRKSCVEFITDYSPLIIDEIIKGATPTFLCMSLGICDAIGLESPPPRYSECQICKMLVDAIYSKLETNTTKDALVKELENVCSYLPYVKGECKQLVDKYGSQVIDMLIEGVPPEEICQKLGFCNSAPLVPKLGDSCTVCEVIINELYIQLRDNVTVERIQHFLETLCSYVPSSYSEKCRSILEQNTALIIDLVEKNYPPRKVCQELSICYYNLQPKTAKCELCKEIIDFIYTQLEDAETEDQIEKVLKNVCDYIPKDDLKATCRAYIHELIDLFIKNVDSVEVCQKLHLCPSRSLIQHLCSGGPSAWCRDNFTAKLCSREDFCQEFIWQGSSFDEAKRRHPVIRRYDCSKLTTMEERCFDKRLMQLCGYESCCINFKRPNVEHSEACLFCRNLLAQRLTYGSFSISCSIFINPREKTLCEAISKLKLAGRTAFDSLESVCKANQLCEPTRNPDPPSSPSAAIKLLGDDPCLWGPSVSCRDLDIAVRCGVTAYCQDNVWKGSQPPSQGSDRVPQLRLADCDRPLNEICVSPDLRYCGPSVLEKCRVFSASRSVGDDIRHEMCKDRPLSFCSDPKMVELCRMGEYCEAMSMTPTPVPPITQVDDAPVDPRCRLGAAFVCQNLKNAVLCGEVELCRNRGFLASTRRRSELEG